MKFLKEKTLPTVFFFRKKVIKHVVLHCMDVQVICAEWSRFFVDMKNYCENKQIFLYITMREYLRCDFIDKVDSFLVSIKLMVVPSFIPNYQTKQEDVSYAMFVILCLMTPIPGSVVCFLFFFLLIYFSVLYTIAFIYTCFLRLCS